MSMKSWWLIFQMLKKPTKMIYLLNMGKREQEQYRLKRLYSFHRLKKIPLQLLVTFVSGQQPNLWFQYAWLDCLLLLFLNSPQLPFMVWNGFSVFLVGFFSSLHLHSLPLTFIDSKCLEFLPHSSHIFQKPLRTLLFKK